MGDIVTSPVPSAIERAREHFTRGAGSEAVKVIELAHEQTGPTVASALLLSEIEFFGGDHPKALSAISQAITLSTRELKDALQDHIVHKAMILTRMGREEAAIDLLRTVPVTGRTNKFFEVLRGAITTPEEVATFEAIAGPSFFQSGMSFVTSLQHYSILLRDMGDHRASLIAARSRFFKTIARFEWGHKARPPEKLGWADAAAACLSDLKHEFDKEGIPFFLISGTFLGAFRDSSILAHDKDIDVGIDESVSLERVRNLFASSTRFALREIPSKRTVFLRHANGVNVDVFSHYMEDGKYWHEGTKVRWWNSPFDTANIHFLDGTYKVPANAERYLTENYGEWKTPVREFETFVDTPNMKVTDPDHLVWYYMSRLTDYYLLGRKAQFSRVWSAFQAMRPVDEELRAAVFGLLELLEQNNVPGLRFLGALDRAQSALSKGPVYFTKGVGRVARRCVRSLTRGNRRTG